MVGAAIWSAVKFLSVPQSEEDLRRARSEGVDDASARSYFHAFVTDIIQEVDLMYEFRGNSNIVSLKTLKTNNFVKNSLNLGRNTPIGRRCSFISEQVSKHKTIL